MLTRTNEPRALTPTFIGRVGEIIFLLLLVTSQPIAFSLFAFVGDILTQQIRLDEVSRDTLILDALGCVWVSLGCAMMLRSLPSTLDSYAVAMIVLAHLFIFSIMYGYGRYLSPRRAESAYTTTPEHKVDYPTKKPEGDDPRQ